MATRKEQLYDFVVDQLTGEPNGLRHSDLVQRAQQHFPDIPEGTIFGSLWTITKERSGEVYKPARGIFRHVKFRETIPIAPEKKVSPATPEGEEAEEENLYEPFANWLVGELEECTKAIELGGNRFGGKWGTPDVIGVLRPRESDIYKPPTEVVSAEVKTDTSQLVVAFGQACAYKLFSHKSYLVVPAESSEEDLSRMDSLCQIFGIGLVLVKTNGSSGPEFEIRLRAARHEPDSFYVNEVLKKVEQELFH